MRCDAVRCGSWVMLKQAPTGSRWEWQGSRAGKVVQRRATCREVKEADITKGTLGDSVMLAFGEECAARMERRRRVRKMLQGKSWMGSD